MPIECPVAPAPSDITVVRSAPSPRLTADQIDPLIAVDGRASQWPAEALFAPDNQADQEAGFLDLRAVTAVANRDALYLGVDLLPGQSKWEQVEFSFEADSRRYVVGWAPHWEHAWVAEATREWTPLPSAIHSRFALGDVMEARFDLRDVPGGPSLTLTGIRVMAGECCGSGWRAVDDWQTKLATPRIPVNDPSWLTYRRWGAREADLDLAAPDTRAISVLFDEVSGKAHVSGGPGAIPPLTRVIFGNLELNDYIATRSDGSGAFEGVVTGFPGTHILIKQDLSGAVISDSPHMFDEDMVVPGVLHRLPVDQSPAGVQFGAGGRIGGDNHSIAWAVEGTYGRSQVKAGERLEVRGKAALFAGPGVQPVDQDTGISMTMISDPAGRQVGRSGTFVTPFLTATGLPIERSAGNEAAGRVWVADAHLEWTWEVDRWVADFAATGKVPEGLADGLYELSLGGLWPISRQKLEPGDNRPFLVTVRNGHLYEPHLGILTVGNPAPSRLAAVLLADELTQGARGGSLAREDAGLFDISSRAVTRHAPIVPRLDYAGDPWTYRLEPYLPMVDAVDRAISNQPLLDFDLAGSELTVTVVRPDGRADRLGPAPLTRYAVKSPRVGWGDVAGRGGGDLREIPQLQGDGDMFAYQFPADGKYVVILDGVVADTDGRSHRICGTYDVTVANVLDIETALLPGTPFEVGDSLPVALNVMPAGPADVEFVVTRVGPDGVPERSTFRGRSNRHGWWDGGGESFRFDVPGEYLVEVEATYADDLGRAWAGALRFGSVVASPETTIVAHGRRGPDNQQEIAPPWAFESAFVMEESDHMQFPYFTGDILWGMNNTDAGDAVVTRTSIQALDQSDPLVQRALALSKSGDLHGGPPYEARLRAGEVPLILAPEGKRRGAGAHPSDLTLWNYMYAAAERPGVRVREIVQGGEVGGVYWRFGDAYHGQAGNGPEGDLPGDFKFMYAGAVIRDPALKEGRYAIYGAGWVHAVDNDPLGARFMPPFQGAAGGPDGGPLFEVHGREIDLFFVPLGVLPGSILETGDRFRMAGPVMPTLPSKIEYDVRSPDGQVRSFEGRANAIGYFYAPADDFAVDQPGLWTVTVRITHDGDTSAGKVAPPYPTGSVLSPDGISYSFLVVDENTVNLEVRTDLEDTPPSKWYRGVHAATFNAQLPKGWAGGTARVIVTMPGVILVDEIVDIHNGSISWDLDGKALHRIAHNFDVEPGLADTITVTFHAEGMVGSNPMRASGSIVTNGAIVPGATPR